MEILQCLTCAEKHKIKMLIKQGNQKDLQIARLKDRLEFASEQADTFVKSLKKIYDSLDKLIDRISYDEEGVIDSLNELKNSIPENALKRAE